VLNTLLKLLLRFGPIGAFLAPILLFGLTAIVAPTYYTPLFGDPLGIWLIAGMLIWDGIGLALCIVFPSTPMRIAVFLLVTLPLIASDMLVPAVMTIVRALGPIMTH
jgi:hypothetical protein